MEGRLRGFPATAGFLSTDEWSQGICWRGGAMTSTMWQCEQLRAGQVYSKMLFQSRVEAESFVQQMQKVAPDTFWRLEPVAAHALWN